MTIAGIRHRGKQFLDKIPPGAVYVAIVLLSSTASFGLGILAAREMEVDSGAGKGFWIEEVSSPSSLPAAAASAVGEDPKPESIPIPEGGQYIASKSGTRYYLPWCGGAKQIKEENRIWFASKEEAESKGYTAAKNCKGI